VVVDSKASPAQGHEHEANGEQTEAELLRVTDSPSNMSYVGEKERENGRDESSEEEDDEDGESGEDEDDEDDEDDSDEEDDDDDEEPTLKYSRIEGSVPEVLKKDSASAISVSGNRLIVRFISCSL
jgi:vacuolar protein sorting-associated protein 41